MENTLQGKKYKLWNSLIFSSSAQSLNGQQGPQGLAHTEHRAEVLTVFLLECLSDLEVLLARACDGVDQIQPKSYPKQNNKNRHSYIHLFYPTQYIF